MILQKNSTEKHVKINNQVKSCFLLFFAQPKTGKCYCINSTQNTAYKSEMPPPGPSQKGKFKPRKPVKKRESGSIRRFRSSSPQQKPDISVIVYLSPRHGRLGPVVSAG